MKRGCGEGSMDEQTRAGKEGIIKIKEKNKKKHETERIMVEKGEGGGKYQSREGRRGLRMD